MKFRYPGVLILLLFLCTGLTSCSKYDDYNYEVTGISLYNANDSTYLPADTSGAIAAKAYMISMHFTAKIYGSNNGADPNESNFKLGNRVARFTVTSLTDFDATHPAMSPLNDYFLYVLYTYGYQPDSIQNCIRDNIMFAAFFERGNLAGEIATGDAYLALMRPPAVLGDRSFVVNVVFADSTRFSDTTTVTLY